LPDPAQAPLLAGEEAYHRLLLRATDRDPARRFDSAAEFGAQLLGVLRQVLAADGTPRPAASVLFTPERRTFGTEIGEVSQEGPELPADATVPDGTVVATGPAGAAVAAALPVPQVDPTDPGAGFLATVQAVPPGELVEVLAAAPVTSPEVIMQRIRAAIAVGDFVAAYEGLDSLDQWDWRVDWMRGVTALAAGRPADARTAFDAVFGALPGELAPQLALAVSHELAGDPAAARRFYQRVWRTDHAYLSAAFGLARTLLAGGERAAAIEILDAVPEHTRHHRTAQVAAARARIAAAPDALRVGDLTDAADRLRDLDLDPERRARLTVEILTAALRWRAHPRAEEGPGRVLGYATSERALRTGLEHAYRDLARAATDPGWRIALVDQANAVRPRTLT
jgi:serine/threonine-protein kinase PknG